MNIQTILAIVIVSCSMAYVLGLLIFSLVKKIKIRKQIKKDVDSDVDD